MSTGYDCDWVQGLCYSVPGRGSPYKTFSDCVTSCSQYCHLPDFMKLGDTEVPVPNSCRKRLVEYYDARRNPCPTSMVECQTQFQPVSGPMAGMAQTTPYIHLTPTMTLDGHGDAIHQAYSALAKGYGRRCKKNWECGRHASCSDGACVDYRGNRVVFTPPTGMERPSVKSAPLNAPCHMIRHTDQCGACGTSADCKCYSTNHECVKKGCGGSCW